MSAPLFTKPRFGILSPAKASGVQRMRRKVREENEAVAAASRDMEWRNVIRPSIRREKL
jgi:hypothetical protein